MTRREEQRLRMKAAQDHLAAMSLEQLIGYTPKRLVDAFGLDEDQAKYLLKGRGL
jgi:hypothetical protein